MLGARLPLGEQAEADPILAALCRHLGEAAVAAARAAGRALTPEAAVAEALALADELVRATPEPKAPQAVEQG